MSARQALLIATDSYADKGFQRLRASESDTRSLAAVLGDPAIGSCQVSVLRNARIYETNRAIEGFFADAARDDFRLVYLSGHGIKDEQGELYFVTTDSQRERLASTAVSAEFVHRQIDRSRCRSVVVWLDCCYAGAFPFGLTHRGAGDAGVLTQLGARGRVVMTSSSALEYSFETGSDTPTGLEGARKSVFTHAIVEGLRTGDSDLNQDGLIDSSELYSYVYERVRQVTPRQTPLLRSDIEGTFTIAARPHGPGRTVSDLRTSAARAKPLAAGQADPSGLAGGRRPTRRTVLRSALGVGVLAAAGIPTGLYLTRDTSHTNASPTGTSAQPTATEEPQFVTDASRPYYFARQPDGALRHWYYVDHRRANETLARGIVGDPAAITTDGDELHVFARDDHGVLRHWGPEHPTGEPSPPVWAHGLASDPTAFAVGAQQHVFALDDQGNLQHWWWDPAENRTQPEPNRSRVPWGSGLTRDPTAIVVRQQQHAFALDNGGVLQHWWWDPADEQPYRKQSAPWGGGLAGNPVAVAVAEEQHVFARDPQGDLWHTWWAPNVNDGKTQSNTWGRELGLVGDPSVLVTGDLQVHAFARDEQGALWHVWRVADENGGEPQQDRWGNGLASDPTAMILGKEQHVFALDTDGAAHHWTWDPARPDVRHEFLGH